MATVVNAQAALNVHEDPTLCLRQLSLQHVLERLVLCRCVDRFDHHCPAICNCVGKGNQRTYTAWLTVLLLAQILFLHLSCLFCARVARHHWNTAGQHDRGGFTDLWPGLSLVYRLHPGKVLLIVIEVSSVYWVGRSVSPCLFGLWVSLCSVLCLEGSICLTVWVMSALTCLSAPLSAMIQTLTQKPETVWSCTNLLIRQTREALPA